MKTKVFSGASALTGMTLVALSILAGCDHDHDIWTPQWGDFIDPGPVVDEMRSVGNIGGVILDGTGHVHIVQGGSPSLRIRTGERLLPNIRTEMQGDDLVIGWTEGMSFSGQAASIEFFVSVDHLDRVELRGAGWINGTDIVGDRLTVVRTGVGDIDLAGLNVGEIDVNQMSIGNVGVRGTAHKQTVTLDGIGNYNARDLASSIAEVTLRSSGSATVRVSERLTAWVHASGSVYYLGDPTVERRGLGSGSVQAIQ